MAVHFAFFSNDLVRQKFESVSIDRDSFVNRCSSIENLNDKLALFTANTDVNKSMPLVFLDSGTIETFSKSANNLISGSFRIVLINTFETMADYLLRINDQVSPSHLINMHDENFKTKIERIIEAYLELDSGGSKSSVVEIFLKESKALKRVDLKVSSERWALYDNVQKFLESLDCFPDFSNIAITIVSELVTNAFYHAPVSRVEVTPGKTNRTSIIAIPPPALVNFIYGKTAKYLWLAVCDPFGTLDKRTIGEAVHRALKQKTAVLTGNGGAGLGMAMMLTMSSEVLIAIDARKQTWVACKLLLTKRNKIFSSQTVEYHLF